MCMNLCQEIDTARTFSAPKLRGRAVIRAHRKNSHGEQIKVINVVLRFDSAAYCSNGYVVEVD